MCFHFLVSVAMAWEKGSGTALGMRVFAGLLLWSEMWRFSGVSCQGGGWWETVVENAGISTMHAAVTHMGNVVLLDRTNIGDSQLPLPSGVCRDNPADRVSGLLISTSCCKFCNGAGEHTIFQMRRGV